MREQLLIWLKGYTKNDELQDHGLPALIIDKMIEWEEKELGVVSESVSRHSVSYTQALPVEIQTLISSLKRVRMV